MCLLPIPTEDIREAKENEKRPCFQQLHKQREKTGARLPAQQKQQHYYNLEDEEEKRVEHMRILSDRNFCKQQLFYGSQKQKSSAIRLYYLCTYVCICIYMHE